MKKRRILALILAALTTIGLLSGCSHDKSDELTKITLNEVAHSIFYAPQYVAIELGYFKDEGIDLTVETGFGADKTMTALLSGNADIGFMGSEASIYAYTQGAKDYAVNFAQLTKRAGNFLVSRSEEPDFDWNSLKGKTVLGGRAGGMPQMVLEYVLKQKGIDLSEIDIVQNIDFGLTAGAFSGGQGDYTVEFEPGATSLELAGDGYVVASLGVESGYVPYTAYCAKQSFIDDNPEIISGFTRAIEKGMAYVASHSSEDIAEIIAPQFDDIDVDKIAIIIERYKSQDTWKTDPTFEKEAFELLKDILKEAGELDVDVPYEDLVMKPET